MLRSSVVIRVERRRLRTWSDLAVCGCEALARWGKSSGRRKDMFAACWEVIVVAISVLRLWFLCVVYHMSLKEDYECVNKWLGPRKAPSTLGFISDILLTVGKSCLSGAKVLEYELYYFSVVSSILCVLKDSYSTKHSIHPAGTY